MKKTFTLTSFFFVLAVFVQAQQPANPGFENWTIKTLYEDPVSYTVSSNSYSYLTTSQGNVKKVTDKYHGTYAAQLNTVITGSDTTSGLLLIGSPGQGGVDGGMPYTGQPDSVSAYVKYDIKLSDTAYFAVGFKKNGVLIALASKPLTGIQATYKRIAIPTNLPSLPAPDSMIVLISSSNLDPPQIPGSTLTIDSITFIGATLGFPNPSFENWTTLSSEEPDNWTTINFASAIPSATKSTDKNSGTYSLKLETIKASWGDTIGLITNGRLGNNGMEGGMPVYANPMKVTGYYKYVPVGPDTALAGLTSFINSVKMDSGLTKLIATNTFTYFEINLSYNNFPYIDTLNIAFASSHIEDSTAYIGLGSVLYIDDIAIVYNPVGTENELIADKHSLFPNPFSDAAMLIFNNPNNLNHQLLLHDVLGNVVMKKENITSNNIVIQRSNLPAGIYEYSILETTQGNIAASGKLVID